MSIILNILRPENKKDVADWPECSFFAIYDGHGGEKCAEYLRDNLHKMVVYIFNYNFNNFYLQFC